MQFFVRQKSLGNRKSIEASVSSEPILLDITDSPIKAQHLISKLVTQQVNDFNARIEQQKQALSSTQTGSHSLSRSGQAINATSPTRILTQQTLDSYLFNLGKVDFANIANLTTVSLDEAIINTLQSFQDGLFIMFVDDVEVKDLSQSITVFEGCAISFIRLTFLVGGWC